MVNCLKSERCCDALFRLKARFLSFLSQAIRTLLKLWNCVVFFCTFRKQLVRKERLMFVIYIFFKQTLDVYDTCDPAKLTCWKTIAALHLTLADNLLKNTITWSTSRSVAVHGILGWFAVIRLFTCVCLLNYKCRPTLVHTHLNPPHITICAVRLHLLGLWGFSSGATQMTECIKSSSGSISMPS